MSIKDEDFKKAVLLGIQVISTHACALALASRQPNPNYGKPMGNVQPENPTNKQKDKRAYIPMSYGDQMYHVGAQRQFNLMIDDLVGTADEEAAMAPHVVPPAEAPDNVVELRGDNDDD